MRRAATQGRQCRHSMCTAGRVRCQARPAPPFLPSTGLIREQQEQHAGRRDLPGRRRQGWRRPPGSPLRQGAGRPPLGGTWQLWGNVLARGAPRGRKGRQQPVRAWTGPRRALGAPRRRHRARGRVPCPDGAPMGAPAAARAPGVDVAKGWRARCARSTPGQPAPARSRRNWRLWQQQGGRRGGTAPAQALPPGSRRRPPGTPQPSGGAAPAQPYILQRCSHASCASRRLQRFAGCRPPCSAPHPTCVCRLPRTTASMLRSWWPPR